jgi:hypothetical protein
MEVHKTGGDFLYPLNADALALLMREVMFWEA